jgi:rhombotail lipoprotein
MRSLAPALATLLLAACATPPMQQRAAVVDYLYPSGSDPVPPADVQLALPVRVGLAFAPGSTPYGSALDESQKQRLLERIAQEFEGAEGVESIQIVPTSYLKAEGGFENLAQLRGLLGVDLMALVSYEQTQFSDVNKASLAYWTIVGAYVVEGNENETHTFVDLSLFDITSRALLFNAAGTSKVERSSTAIESTEALRSDSAKGFDRAITGLIGELELALAQFREQAKSGTVRGRGTPAIAVTGGTTGSGGGSGAGAAGALELALVVALGAAGGLLRRRARV